MSGIEAADALARINRLLEEHFQTEAAINSVWRKARQSKEPEIRIADLADAVLARNPHAWREWVVAEFCRRMERTRARRPRAGAAP